MRRPAVFLCGARVVAAIRAWLPGLLRQALAAARPQHHDFDAGFDADARLDLQRMGEAWHLLGPWRAGLFRDYPESPLGGEDPAGISRIVRGQDRGTGRDRG